LAALAMSATPETSKRKKRFNFPEPNVVFCMATSLPKRSTQRHFPDKCAHAIRTLDQSPNQFCLIEINRCLMSSKKLI
jgi:hypothetical protein